MRRVLSSQASRVEDIVALVTTHVPAHVRLAGSSLAVVAIAARNRTAALVNNKITSAQDWEWQGARGPRAGERPLSRTRARFAATLRTYKSADAWLTAELGYSTIALGREFAAATEPVAVVTPLTHRCHLAMAIAMRACSGSVVCGGPDTGKSLTVRGLARSLGRLYVSFLASSRIKQNSCVRLLKGIAANSAWGCIENVTAMSQDILRVLAHSVTALNGALRRKAKSVKFDGECAARAPVIYPLWRPRTNMCGFASQVRTSA